MITGVVRPTLSFMREEVHSLRYSEKTPKSTHEDDEATRYEGDSFQLESIVEDIQASDRPMSIATDSL